MSIPVCAIGKLLLRLGPSLLGLTRARKQAVRGFREGLADCGLPPQPSRNWRRPTPV